MVVGEEPIASEVKENASKEMADIFSICYRCLTIGIDLVDAARKKLEERHARFPVDKSRRSSKKYTEFKKVYESTCGI